MSSKPNYFSLSIPTLALMLVGCAGEVRSSGGSADGAPSSSFKTSEFKAFSARARQPSCELSAQCKRDSAGTGNPSETCVQAAKSCLQSVASQVSGPLAQLAECEAVRACTSDGDNRAQCADDFRSCVRRVLGAAAAGSNRTATADGT